MCALKTIGIFPILREECRSWAFGKFTYLKSASPCTTFAYHMKHFCRRWWMLRWGYISEKTLLFWACPLMGFSLPHIADRWMRFRHLYKRWTVCGISSLNISSPCHQISGRAFDLLSVKVSYLGRVFVHNTSVWLRGVLWRTPTTEGIRRCSVVGHPLDWIHQSGQEVTCVAIAWTIWSSPPSNSLNHWLQGGGYCCPVSNSEEVSWSPSTYLHTGCASCVNPTVM